MPFHRISEEANINRVPGCPVQIRHCTILRDEKTRARYLELDLRNESDKTIAAITALIVCTGDDGAELYRSEQLCYAHHSYRAATGKSPSALLLPPTPCRVAVRLTKILAFQQGEGGECVDITCAE